MRRFWRKLKPALSLEKMNIAHRIDKNFLLFKSTEMIKANIELQKKQIAQKVAKFARKNKINRNVLHYKSELSQKCVIDIEEGRSNYTIDSLLKYLNTLGLKIQIVDKEGNKL